MLIKPLAKGEGRGRMFKAKYIYYLEISSSPVWALSTAEKGGGEAYMYMYNVFLGRCGTFILFLGLDSVGDFKNIEL